MAKPNLKEWPWNNQPSSKHVWYVKSQNVDSCHRCGCAFIRSGGGTGPVYCVLGPVKTPFG